MASIADYAVIGDGRSAALVCRDGSIDWLCWPRFDSPSIFGAVLDAEHGGSWRVAPRGAVPAGRRYLDDSNVLASDFAAPGGRARVTDFMPVYAEEEKKQQLLPEHEIVRIVECLEGAIEVECSFAPRPGYGGRAPRFRLGPFGVRFEDASAVYNLRADRPFAIGGDSCCGAFRLAAGERATFSLAYDAHGPAVLPPLGDRCLDARDRSAAWWRQWAGKCRYDGPHRHAVIRSLLALKILGYAPSGAIVAAATTSLPERVGGDLNWDYRFCWLRDAALTVRALLDVGYLDEAAAFTSWLLHTTRMTRPELRVLYDVYGELPRRERVLTHLSGHRGSRPVRIRNAAIEQLQLDVYGEVIDAVARICRCGAALDGETQQMLRQFGGFVCRNWQRADQGLWEPRLPPQHHTHSRALCWVALDRLLELDRQGSIAGVPRAEYAVQREAIRREVEERGWNERIGSYTQVLGGDTVDASLLLLGWYGFVAPAGPRMKATFAAVRRRLEPAPALLYRYEQSRGVEGAFGLCSFWAVELLAAAGAFDEAEERFERLVRCANDVGLLAEEIDPANGEPLGNFPQAFTHVGLVGAALALDERRRRKRPEPEEPAREVRL